MVKIAILFDIGSTKADILAAVEAHFSGDHTASRTTLVEPEAGHNANGAALVYGSANEPGSTQAAAAGHVQLDNNGLPWDARIHSSNKEMTAKGIWVKRRGVDDSVFNSVAAQLRATIAAAPAAGSTLPNLPQTNTTAGVPIPANVLDAINRGETVTLTPEQTAWLQNQAKADAPATGGTVPALGATTTQPGALPPLPGQAATLPPLPAATPSPEQVAYQALVQLVTRNLKTDANPNGRLSEEWVSTVIAHFGVLDANGNGSLTLLVNRPDVVKQVADYIAAQGVV